MTLMKAAVVGLWGLSAWLQWLPVNGRRAIGQQGHSRFEEQKNRVITRREYSEIKGFFLNELYFHIFVY